MKLYFAHSAASIVLTLLAGCAAQAPVPVPAPVPAAPALDAERLLIVDCLLPGQVRQLGAFATGVSPRRPAKLPAHECEQSGGEFALANSDPKRALNIWLPFAQQGDAHAEVQVGELYERGIGALADYASAAAWYQRAAERGDARAAVNLASLYERGLGVGRDPDAAARLYRRASGLAPAPARLSIHLVEPMIVLPSPAADGAPPTVRVGGSGSGTSRELTGRVSADAGVKRVTVNEQPVAVDAQGVFRTRVDFSRGPAAVRISATDAQGNRASAAFNAVGGLASAAARGLARLDDFGLGAGGDGGDYHALVIANQNYRHWERLDTPLHDAQDLKALLERRFGFKVTLLADATRRDMFSALNALRGRLSANDKLLVFYAGHGDIDPLTQRGYWVPVDGERRNRSNWVSVLDVTDQLNALEARQVLVVADSCYSGTMARSALPALETGLAPNSRWEAMRSVARLRARVVLTSGGLEPVADGGAGRNSLFTRSLLDVLDAVIEPIETRRVHQELAARFALRAQRLRLTQRPEYAPIRFAGHEAGDFLFVPRR